MTTPDPHSALLKKLESLGAERLSATLLALADVSAEAATAVTRLTASPAQNIKRIKARLAAQKRASRFIDWRGARAFGRELAGLVADIRESAPDPETGLDLVARFFRLDEVVFERVDDSDGSVAPAFKQDAQEAFLHFAGQVSDKVIVLSLVLDLLAANGYGARDTLLDGIGSILTEAQMSELIDACRKRANAAAKSAEANSTSKYDTWRWLHNIQELARQLGDADLFRDTRLEVHSGSAACLDIARVYLETDNYAQATHWIEQIDEGEQFNQAERRTLHIDICRRSGDTAKLTELAWQAFRAGRSSASVEQLMRDIGATDRAQLVDNEIRLICEQTIFNGTDLAFLIEENALKQAAQYVLERAEQIEGAYFYDSLLTYASVFSNAGFPLPASMIFRALLDAILAAGRTNAYGHGARYLLAARTLSRDISDWQQLETHEQYETGLRSRHGQKRSFWMKVDGRKPEESLSTKRRSH